MRIALFVTCLVDTLFPDAGQATVRLLERLGHEVEFPAAQTCCGQMHVNTGYLPRGAAAGPPLRRGLRAATTRSWPRPARASGRSGTSTPWWPGGTGTKRWPAAPRRSPPGPTSCPSCWSTCSGWRTSAPTTRTGSPTTRPATRCGCCGSATSRCGCCATCRASTWSSCRTRTTCCGFGGTFAVKNADISTAMLADKMRSVLDTGAEVCTAGDSSCLMHIGGGLSRLRDRRSAPCTSPRSWPRTAGRAPA